MAGDHTFPRLLKSAPNISSYGHSSRRILRYLKLISESETPTHRSCVGATGRPTCRWRVSNRASGQRLLGCHVRSQNALEGVSQRRRRRVRDWQSFGSEIELRVTFFVEASPCLTGASNLLLAVSKSGERLALLTFRQCLNAPMRLKRERN